MDKLEIAEEIRKHRLFIGVCRIAMLSMHSEIRHQIVENLGLKSGDGYAFMLPLYKKGRTPVFNDKSIAITDDMYFIDGDEAMTYADENLSVNIEFLNIPISNAFVRIGHLLSENKYFEKTPELEFFRHLRNGIAHDNLLTFNKNEPVNPASFKQFTITKNDEGAQVLHGDGNDVFLDHGDIMELFEAIENYLRKDI